MPQSNGEENPVNETERNQMYRYDLQESRPPLTSLSSGGTKIVIALNVLFLGVLAALTYAAVQVFDGWHHAIVIADMGIVLIAIAFWIASMRTPAEIESDSSFIPLGMRPADKR